MLIGSYLMAAEKWGTANMLMVSFSAGKRSIAKMYGNASRLVNTHEATDMDQQG